jgi:SM-20-related protein
MSDPNLINWPNLFVVKTFLDSSTCANIVAEMTTAQGDAATVYGKASSGIVDQNVRQTLRLQPSHATRVLITKRLLDHKHAFEQHFDVALSECEEPQFLRYRIGDFFVAHQDGNTGMTRLDTERRLVSIVIFLGRESDTPKPDAYCGGSLVFTNLRVGPNNGKFRLQAEPGTLVAFRAETTHEVTSVTHGERYSIVSWFR